MSVGVIDSCIVVCRVSLAAQSRRVIPQRRLPHLEPQKLRLYQKVGHPTRCDPNTNMVSSVFVHLWQLCDKQHSHWHCVSFDFKR